MLNNIDVCKNLYIQLINPICKKFDLTQTEVLILSYLANKPKNDTATEIAKKYFINKSLISISLRDLQEKELISSCHLDGNHRTLHLKLEDKSKEIIKEIKKIQTKFNNIITKGFDENELDTFKEYFLRINQNIERYNNEF